MNGYWSRINEQSFNAGASKIRIFALLVVALVLVAFEQKKGETNDYKERENGRHQGTIVCNGSYLWLSSCHSSDSC